jgi:hypothetical protein
MRSPSLTKKNSRIRARIRAVSPSTTDATRESAPLATAPPCACSPPSSCAPNVASWSRSSPSGPDSSQSSRRVAASCTVGPSSRTCSRKVGHERGDPAMASAVPPKTTTDAANAGGAPRRSRTRAGGTARVLRINARITGTVTSASWTATTTSTEIPSSTTSSRQVQAVVVASQDGTRASSGRLLVVSRTSVPSGPAHLVPVDARRPDSLRESPGRTWTVDQPRRVGLGVSRGTDAAA